MAVNKIQISVAGDDRHKSNIKKELIASDNWKANWTWMVKEYDNLKKELDKITAQKRERESVNLQSRKDLDKSLKPFPITTNGMYGWLAAKADCQLETMGPDIMKFPLPDLPK